MLTKYTELAAGAHVTLSILAAIVISILVYFGYVKPMENSENSTGFYQGAGWDDRHCHRTASCRGFGEVMVKIGAGNTTHIASSFDRQNLPAGVRVVVVDVVEGVLRVSELEERKGED